MKLSKEESEKRLEMAVMVYSGHLTLQDGAQALGLKNSAFACWVLRNKAKIVIVAPAPNSVKCEFCDWHFINRFALGAHLVGAHPGAKIGNCGRCGAILSEDNVSHRRADGRLCTTCAELAHAEWKDAWKQRGTNSGYYRTYHKRIRAEAIAAYGGVCSCCGEKHLEFLTIDHINGGGNAHKKTIKQSIYYWLRKNKFPEGYQVLCFNCNCAKGIYGVCPHTWLVT